MGKNLKTSIKRKLFGVSYKDGLIYKLVIYVLLIGIGFIFLYPILQMLSRSFMSVEDLIDPTSVWIPSQFNFENYKKAWQVMNVFSALKDSLMVSILPTLCVVLSSALVGYGFARYEFPLKKLLMSILILMFLIPTVLMAIPTYVIYRNFQLIDSLKAFTIPALFGFGLRQTLFILLFYQFFKMIPKELTDAASVDGASTLRIFVSIAIPSSLPAFLITSLYAFVWYWNETTLATLYFPKAYQTIPMAVQSFKAIYESMFPGGNVGLDGLGQTYNQAVQFAGTVISIIPLIIVYMIGQKWFVEGIDRSGITGI